MPSKSPEERDPIEESAQEEDILLSEFAKKREKTFDKSLALEHEEVWPKEAK